MKETVE